MFEPEILKMPVDLETALMTETRPAEGQGLEEQLNMVMLLMFQQGSEGQLFQGDSGNI
jgi:hypothetical protein